MILINRAFKKYAFVNHTAIFTGIFFGTMKVSIRNRLFSFRLWEIQSFSGKSVVFPSVLLYNEKNSIFPRCILILYEGKKENFKTAV
jgi:hypothetical protein